MESYPTTKVIFDRRKQADKENEGTIEVEVYFKRKRKWISTGTKVLPKNWNPVKRVVGRIDSADLNLRISKIENKIIYYIRKLMVEEKPFTWAGLESVLIDNQTNNSFLDFVKNQIESRTDIRDVTRKNHRKFYNALKEFNKIRDFGDINKTNIQLYDTWIRQRRACTQATVASYHKYLKTYINVAIQKEKILYNPYSSIKIDRGKYKIRKYLTAEELSLMEHCELATKSLEKTRDIFLFQCYTGLAYVDLCKFDFNLVTERNGKYVIHDVRHKTGEDFYIVLSPKAIQILKRYDYKLPIMSNQQFNMRLKIAADSAGIEKKVTSHMGRHTFATMCLNSGIKIEVLAKMMGHSDIKTTQIYARMINTTVENAYDVLEESDNIKDMAVFITSFLDALTVILHRIGCPQAASSRHGKK